MYQSGVSAIVYASISGINHSVCINQGYQSYSMYQSGVAVIVYISISSINDSVCINQVE